MKTSWILLLGAVAGLTACHRHAEAPAPPIRPVLSIVAAPEAAGGAAFAGTVEARYESILGFQVLGRMIARDVNVGDQVKQGARLAALDPIPFQLALRNAEADLARTEAHRQEAQLDAARQRQLFSKGVSAKADFEAAQHEWESAEASTAAARANVRQAQERLGYTELHAGFDGVIVATKAEVGQVVQPGQEVLSVVRPEEREAVVDVPDQIAVNLRPGKGFIVTSEADPATRVKGQVREIAPQADLATRTRRVRITLVDPPLNFRLGSIVKAVAGIDAGAQIELPSSALLERDGKTFVWVVDAATRKVSIREVKIGARDADSFRVAEGLAAGTRVVTAGVHSLLPDQVVKIQDTQPMKTSFNLSEWALRHRSLVWYFMGIFAVMGVASYLNLGREEDPSFTIKTMLIQAQWPGASVDEMSKQVTERIERKLEELDVLDYTKSMTMPGQTIVFVYLRDATKGRDVPNTWMRVRNMMNDIRADFPSGVTDLTYNDTFGDVFGNIYAFTSDGLTQRQLRDYVEHVRRECC
jgi:RND family efflux transporter, MFP subunit